MSAFYGIPEGEETAVRFTAVPTPKVEPVDDPQYLMSPPPDRDLVVDLKPEVKSFSLDTEAAARLARWSS
jgi:hypothetical protein